MQILKNIFLLSGESYPYIPSGPVGDNVFVIKGENALVLTDSGGEEEEVKLIDEGLEYWGLSDFPISHVLVCHGHQWHMGNARIFRERGAKIVAGRGDTEAIEQGDDRVVDSPPFKTKPYVPCIVDMKVKDGDIVKAAGLEFEVIEVPGHTPGSVFYKLIMDGKTILFTGDAVTVGPECKYAVLGWPGGAGYNRERYFESIKKVSKMHADIILPSEYQPCLVDGWKILRDSYHKALLDWRQPANYDD